MAIPEYDTRASRRSLKARASALAAVALCLLAARASGATVSLKVTPSVAEFGEAVTLEVSVRNGTTNQPRVTLPEGVHIVSSHSPTSMTQVLNGRRSSFVTFTYELAVDAAGAHVIGPATARVGARDVPSATARVVVKKRVSPLDVRVFASLEPARAYVGQPVGATFEFAVSRGKKVRGYSLAIPFLKELNGAKVYDPENLDGRSRRNSAGLQRLDVAQPGTRVMSKVSTRKIDGVSYETYTVRRAILPATPGRYDLGKASIVALVVTGQRRVRDMFGFIRTESTTKKMALVSKPLSLEVLAPPAEGRPPDYSGAVGAYELSARAVPHEVALGGEPVVLTLTVRGEGNIETVPQPTLADDSGWRVGSAEQKQETGFEGGRPVGEKRFTIPLRPRSAEVMEIPAVELVVFDPTLEAYVTLRTEPIPVRVTVPEDSGALEGVALPETARARMREREEVKQDIEDIETRVDATVSDAAWLHGSGGLVMFFALPLAAYAAASMVARRRRELKENTALARRLSAARDARAAFGPLHGDRDAEGAASLPHADFAEAVAKVLQGYLADRLDRPGGEIPPDEAERLLAESGVDADRARETAEVLREAGAARFGGGGVEPGELLRRAEACVEAVEKGGAS